MRKYLILGFLVALTVTPALAQTSTTTTLTVAQLQQIIAQLQAQLADLMQQLGQSQGGSGTSDYCYAFTRDLAVGSQGDDVTALQKFLNSRGFSLNLTADFDPLTKAALAKYQASVGLPAVGYFGPMTRANLGALCGPPPITTLDKLLVQLSPDTPAGTLSPGQSGATLARFTFSNDTDTTVGISQLAFYRQGGSDSDIGKLYLYNDNGNLLKTTYFDNGYAYFNSNSGSFFVVPAKGSTKITLKTVVADQVSSAGPISLRLTSVVVSGSAPVAGLPVQSGSFLLSPTSVVTPSTPFTPASAINAIWQPDKKSVYVWWMGGQNVKQYAVYRCPGSPTNCGGSQILTADTSWEDKAVAPGQVYYYAVDTQNQSGAWNYEQRGLVRMTTSVTIPVTATTTPPPFFAPATAPTVTLNSDQKSVHVAWSGGQNVKQYAVYRCPGSPTNCGSSQVLTTDTSWDDTAVSSGQTYYYAVDSQEPGGNWGHFTAGNQSVTIPSPVPAVSAPNPTPVPALTTTYLQYDQCSPGDTVSSWITDQTLGRRINQCIRTANLTAGQTFLTKSYTSFDNCAAGDTASSYYIDPIVGKRVYLCNQYAPVTLGGSYLTQAYLQYGACTAGDLITGWWTDSWAKRTVYECNRTTTYQAPTANAASLQSLANALTGIKTLLSSWR